MPHTPFRQARVAAGLTQQALADAAHVTQATVSQCDRGLVPRDLIRESLARALDTTPVALWPHLDA